MIKLIDLDAPPTKEEREAKYGYDWGLEAFGEEWAKGTLRALRGEQYAEDHLEKVKGMGGSSTPYSCYSTGTTYYRRKDGEAITDFDLECLAAIERGQVNQVTLDNGLARVYWVCDSSG